MGTRHLIVVKFDSKYPVAQYGQFDGYPSGAGLDALRFARKLHQNIPMRELFFTRLREITTLGGDDVRAKWREVGCEGDFASLEQSKAFKERWPWLHRERSAMVLADILEQPAGIELGHMLEFAGDSLFCEWCYVLDLDDWVFEVHKGFNTDANRVSTRFLRIPRAREEYAQVSHERTWYMSSLPSDADFVALFERGN